MSAPASTRTVKMPAQKPSVLERVLRLTRKKPKPRRTTRPINIMDLPRELRQEILFLSLNDTDHIGPEGPSGNRYVAHFLDQRRREYLEDRTKAIQTVHTCLSADIAYVVGKWWEGNRLQRLDLKEEFRVFRKGYLDGSLLQNWNQELQNHMFEIAVFARVVAVLEWYRVHPNRGWLRSWFDVFGVQNRLTREGLRRQMPSTMQEHMEVARVFLRLPEDEPDEEAAA